METYSECINQDGRYLLSYTNYYLDPAYLGRSFFHCQNELEISYIKSGSGIYTVGDRNYEIQKGDIFIFNNIEQHKISFINSGELLTNSVIMFDPKFVWSIEGNLFDAKYLDPFFNRKEEFDNRLDRNNPASKEIEKLFHEIEDEFTLKHQEYTLMVKVKLLNMLVTLIRHYGCAETSVNNHAKRKQDITLINKIIDYIDQNISQPIRHKDIAKIAHMNPTYLTVFFKKYIGISPSEYILKKRISKAVDYLKNTDKSVVEISGICGFECVSNFYRIFKKLSGRVPSSFR